MTTTSTLVRLDLEDAAVVQVTGALEADGLQELAAVVRRTQHLSPDVVVDVSQARPAMFVLELLAELASGRQGCAPFQVRGAACAATTGSPS